jgi:hypothetical protein
MRVLAIWRSVAAWLIVLGLAAPAYGADSSAPWSGGAAVVTPFEARASVIAGSLAGHEASIECAGPAAWHSLSARYDFDPALTWALTPLRWDSSLQVSAPEGQSMFSPRACRLANAFVLAPTRRGARICRHGTRTVQQTLPGPRKVRRKVPVLGECDGWAGKLLAVHVLGHESMHLAGVVGEAQADCLAAQLDAYVAADLGASMTFARSLAREYWRYYYPSQDARYRSADCRSGGALDLFPNRAGWPTPDAYPQDPALSIAHYLATTQATNGSG